MPTHHKSPRNAKREAALCLYKLAESGVALDEDMLEILKEYDFDKNSDPHDRDEFSYWCESDWVDGLELTPENLKNAPIETVTKAIKDWKFDRENTVFQEEVFRALFLDNPQRTLNATCRLADDGIWQPYAWHVCLYTLKIEMAEFAEMVEQINPMLASATDEQLKQIENAVLRYLNLISTQFDVSQEYVIRKLWLRIWKIIDRKQTYIMDKTDVINEAFNSPVGTMTTVALTRLWMHSKIENNHDMPDEIRIYFKTISSAKDGHYGRVILAMRLYSIHQIAPEWTNANLISHLSPTNTTESQELWLAFSTGIMIGPNLLAQIKDPLIEILTESSNLTDAKLRHQLTNLFMTVCLYAPTDSLTPEEIKRVIKTMSEDMLVDALSFIRNNLTRDEKQNAVGWRNRIHPWLDQYWPKLGKFKTSQMSELMVQIFTQCGPAYPDAAGWFMEYLKPVNSRVLDTLNRDQFTGEFAPVTLQVLKKLVDVESISPENKSTLISVLKKIRKNNAGLENDRQFISLCHIAHS